jgi:hypothetical protein
MIVKHAIMILLVKAGDRDTIDGAIVNADHGLLCRVIDVLATILTPIVWQAIAHASSYVKIALRTSL